MVNPTISDGGPERVLVLNYAPAPVRASLAALLALDDRLGAIVRRASDPTIGLMRLTWWADALAALDTGPPPAEPILTALAGAGVDGAGLAAMVDGWELLLDGEPLTEASLEAFGRARGGGLFGALAGVVGGSDSRLPRLGEGWALADLAVRMTDPKVAATARRLSDARLGESFDRPWPRALRPLGALALLARSDLAGGRPGSPARVGRLLLHRLTGR